MQPRVSVIIPTWNRAALLAQVLDNLKQQTHPIHRIIVVDNGGIDDSAEVAARAGAKVIRLGVNAGFAAAVNRGILEAASADLICVLNNDVTLEPDWLAQMTAALGGNDAWFATGKLLDAQAHQRIDGCYDALCRGGCAWRCGNGRLDSSVWNQPRNIRLPPFTAAVFRAALFDRVGLLDERFESYLEDVDFGLRCAQSGLTGLYVPQAVAYHQGSATFGRWHADTVRKIARNQLLLVAKHYPPDWVTRYGWPVFIAQALWGFLALRHGALFSYLQGKVQGMRQFRAARTTYCVGFPPIANISVILDQSEKEIRDLQQLSGFDPYWRLYFALTRSPGT